MTLTLIQATSQEFELECSNGKIFDAIFIEIEFVLDSSRNIR